MPFASGSLQNVEFPYITVKFGAPRPVRATQCSDESGIWHERTHHRFATVCQISPVIGEGVCISDR